MRNLIFFSLAFMSTIVLQGTAKADDSFFEISAIESLEIRYLWHSSPYKESLVNDGARIMIWPQRIEVHKMVYLDQKKPVAVILLGRNHVDALPIGVHIFSRRPARVATTMVGSPSSPNDGVLFSLRLEENNCEICNQEWVFIGKNDNGEFTLEREIVVTADHLP